MLLYIWYVYFHYEKIYTAFRRELNHIPIHIYAAHINKKNVFMYQIPLIRWMLQRQANKKEKKASNLEPVGNIPRPSWSTPTFASPLSSSSSSFFPFEGEKSEYSESAAERRPKTWSAIAVIQRRGTTPAVSPPGIDCTTRRLDEFLFFLCPWAGFGYLNISAPLCLFFALWLYFLPVRPIKLLYVSPRAVLKSVTYGEVILNFSFPFFFFFLLFIFLPAVWTSERGLHARAQRARVWLQNALRKAPENSPGRRMFMIFLLVEELANR